MFLAGDEDEIFQARRELKNIHLMPHGKDRFEALDRWCQERAPELFRIIEELKDEVGWWGGSW